MARAASSVDEFAERYGFCRAFVYELCKRGKLRLRKADGRTIITTDDERAWLDSLPAL
jgi:hypothetical protein